MLGASQRNVSRHRANLNALRRVAVRRERTIALLFGAGLAISGMQDPAQVLGFLDIAAITSGRGTPA